MSAYAGESVAKKVARIRVYKRAKRLLRAAGIDERAARYVVIAGPEAHDVGCLRRVMRARPENVLFVDVDDAGLRVASDRWPGVRTHHGLLDADALRGLERIDCAVVDLCGHINTTALSATATRLRMGGVMAYTFLRGRESRGRLSSSSTLGIGWRKELFRSLPSMKDAAWSDGARGSDLERAESYVERANELRVGFNRAGLLQSVAGGEMTLDEYDAEKQRLLRRPAHWPKLFQAGWVSYWSGHSPMGVVVMQLRTPPALSLPRNGFRRHVAATWDRAFYAVDRDSASTVVHPHVELLRELDELAGSGLDRDALCDVASVSKGRLAAWKAHRTMGSYAAEAS